jgi:hypothetical protein
MKDLFSGCATKTGITLMAPLKIPVYWTNVLRLAPATKPGPDKLFEVQIFVLSLIFSF